MVADDVDREKSSVLKKDIRSCHNELKSLETRSSIVGQNGRSVFNRLKKKKCFSQTKEEEEVF